MSSDPVGDALRLQHVRDALTLTEIEIEIEKIISDYWARSNVAPTVLTYAEREQIIWQYLRKGI